MLNYQRVQSITSSPQPTNPLNYRSLSHISSIASCFPAKCVNLVQIISHTYEWIIDGHHIHHHFRAQHLKGFPMAIPWPSSPLNTPGVAPTRGAGSVRPPFLHRTLNLHGQVRVVLRWSDLKQSIQGAVQGAANKNKHVQAHLVGGWALPFWKIWKSIGMIINYYPMYGKIKNVPNHQPDMVFLYQLRLL